MRLPTVLLNSPQIFEKIFGDELIMDIIGALECKFQFSFVYDNLLYQNEVLIFEIFFVNFGDYEVNFMSETFFI